MELPVIQAQSQVQGQPAPSCPAAGNGVWALLVSTLATTAAEICLKIGASETAAHPLILPWLGLSGLGSKWVWFGIILTVLSFLAWIRAIRAIPLSIAFTCSNVIHVFMPLGCWLILGEAISPRRWLGIAFVIAGLLVIARPFGRLNEKLDEAL
jgi:undecaprenyl phosphate-alpha-L-ara4N flippase subunit ArnF